MSRSPPTDSNGDAMKNITIHPLSALLGAAFLAVPLVLVSFQAQAWPSHVPIPVTVQELVDPHDMVVIREEDGAYTVPVGKLFVLTGIGRGELAGVRVYVDGVVEMDNSTTGLQQSILEAPLGCTVSAGSIVEPRAKSGPTNGRAWGYLVDA